MIDEFTLVLQSHGTSSTKVFGARGVSVSYGCDDFIAIELYEYNLKLYGGKEIKDQIKKQVSRAIKKLPASAVYNPEMEVKRRLMEANPRLDAVVDPIKEFALRIIFTELSREGGDIVVLMAALSAVQKQAHDKGFEAKADEVRASFEELARVTGMQQALAQRRSPYEFVGDM